MANTKGLRYERDYTFTPCFCIGVIEDGSLASFNSLDEYEAYMDKKDKELNNGWKSNQP